MSIYEKATVVKMVRESDDVLDSFAIAIERAGKFVNAVSKHGYNSAKAESAFINFAGEIGTMDAAITNAGYVRPQPAQKAKAKPTKAKGRDQ